MASGGLKVVVGSTKQNKRTATKLMDPTVLCHYLLKFVWIFTFDPLHLF